MSKQYPGGIISKTPVVPSGPYETSTASGIWTLDQQAAYAKLGQWPTAGNVQPDAQFNYVTMLLHGDGTNGAQNNTFLDSSTNNFTITRNGNTTQGSFSPYGSNWSNYFNGTSTIAFPSNSAFAFGTGAYTVEMWIFITAIGSNGFSHFFNAGNDTGSFGFATATGYSLNVFGYGTGSVITGSTNDITPNQWQHIAVCRSSTSSNDTKIYVNGVLKTTGTDSTNWTVTTTPAVGGITNLSGYSTIGYISNCRVVKGTAVYTAAFTPPTAPLTAISGTSLLTCADNRFVDDSTNNFAITVNGTPSVQRFNPFGTSTAYSTSVIGGSGYFDGSGDYLQSGNEASLEIGTGNFTIEMWAYRLSGTNNGLFQLSTTAGGFKSNDVNNLALAFASGGLTYYANNNSYAPSVTVNSNDWNHLALVRSGTTTTLYFNGVSVSSITDSTNYTGTYLVVGGYYDTTYVWNGYISNFRIVKGTAVYTSAFTPPTAPVTAITNTQLLLNYTNGAIFDNAMMNDLETVGNAQISTSVKKYGTGSMSFVRSPSSYLVANNTTGLLSLGTGDWTVEAWVYMNTLPSGNGYSDSYWIVGGGPVSSDAGFDIAIGNTNLQVGLTSFASLNINTAHGMSQTTWYHVAVARSGVTLYAFINGVQLTSASVSGVTVDPCLTGLAISAAEPTGATLGNFNGYIDDLRITKGYARYTAAFTPPTAAFPNIGPT